MAEKVYLNYHFKFVCPQCGGTHVGSRELDDGSLIRHCHGIAGSRRGCGYTWHQDDDEKYIYIAYRSVKDHLVIEVDEESAGCIQVENLNMDEA